MKPFKNLIFGGPFGQERSQNGIFGGRKNLRGEKLGGQNNVFRQKKYEILLKIRFN